MGIIKNLLDYSNSDYEAFRQFMIEQLGINMPEYTDKSQTDAGIVILELLAKGLDIISFQQDVQANESFLTTLTFEENALKWCDTLGYIPRGAVPSQFKQIFKLNSTQSVDTLIPKGTIVKTEKDSVESSVLFETLDNLIIPAGKYGDEQTGGTYDYVVNIIQGVTVTNETLSLVTSNTTGIFNHTPVINSSVALLVNEGFGFSPWVRVNSFIDSDSSSPHFKVVSLGESSYIEFGDGINGKIPTEYVGGLKVTYRIGGGKVGNVSSHKITVLDSSIPYVTETYNPEVAFVKGVDRETVSEIKINAPNSWRTKWACITLRDYADKVIELFPGVKYASAEVNPEDIDNVIVNLLPENGDSLDTNLELEIRNMFLDRALIGTTVTLHEASGSDFIPLDFYVNIFAKTGFSNYDIKEAIKSYLTNRFKLGNYPFETPLSLLSLETEIFSNVSGMLSLKLIVNSSISQETDLVILPAVNQILTFNLSKYKFQGGIDDIPIDDPDIWGV
jgi:hypothetical protein